MTITDQSMSAAKIKKMATSAKTVDAIVGYEDSESGQQFFLMINQAIHIHGLENYLLCPCSVVFVGIPKLPNPNRGWPDGAKKTSNPN